MEESVDEVLQGGRPIVQVRKREEATGEVVVDRTVYDMDVSLANRNVAYTLGSMGGVMAATAKMENFGIQPATSAAAAMNNISPLMDHHTNTSGGGGGGGHSGNNNVDVASTWNETGSGLGDDPYAWAHNLGKVPDKDALASMEAGYGYLAGQNHQNASPNGGGTTEKRGNGKREKKSRLRAQQRH